MFGWWYAGVVLLAGASGIAGVVALLPRRPGEGVAVDAPVPRTRLFVRANADRIGLAIARETGIAVRREDAGYGHIYIADAASTRLLLRSRSEIGRSFEGEIRMIRRPSYTVVDYHIHAVPDGGDSLLTAIQHFDRALVEALRRIDPDLVARYPQPERAGRPVLAAFRSRSTAS